jgi:hypothetical protein
MFRTLITSATLVLICQTTASAEWLTIMDRERRDMRMALCFCRLPRLGSLIPRIQPDYDLIEVEWNENLRKVHDWFPSCHGGGAVMHRAWEKFLFDVPYCSCLDYATSWTCGHSPNENNMFARCDECDAIHRRRATLSAMFNSGRRHGMIDPFFWHAACPDFTNLASDFDEALNRSPHGPQFR